MNIRKNKRCAAGQRRLKELAHLHKGRPLHQTEALLVDKLLLQEAQEEVRLAPISEAALSDKAQEPALAVVLMAVHRERTLQQCLQLQEQQEQLQQDRRRLLLLIGALQQQQEVQDAQDLQEPVEHKLKQQVHVWLEDLATEALEERPQVHKEQVQEIHEDNQPVLEALDLDKHHKDRRQLEDNEELIFTH